ncbi:hypothetical protein DDZ13_08895 [Coraliomargarita sinensis]|uniref:DUF4296 domain-containing protein n=1 Tax=Coraliomargarita sinensis TaxID=2174842 RepID=A0A317ZFB1_9BACT|nr:hypothetical protein [Coraliomargarita sinensis]PXA04146.1 hypothetical protein DDZ13_08895 [Coraliomargarita sinensis]
MKKALSYLALSFLLLCLSCTDEEVLESDNVEINGSATGFNFVPEEEKEKFLDIVSEWASSNSYTLTDNEHSYTKDYGKASYARITLESLRNSRIEMHRRSHFEGTYSVAREMQKEYFEDVHDLYEAISTYYRPKLSEPVDADNPASPPENSKNQLDD